MQTVTQKNNHKIITFLGLLGIAVTLLLAVLQGDGSFWDMLVSAKGGDSYMDFFNHIKYCENPTQTYFTSHHACFPALAYCLYFVLGRLLPDDAITMFHSDLTAPYARLLYLIYLLVLVVILCALISKALSNYSKKYTALFEIQILLSGCVLLRNIERGNSSFLVLIILLAALVLKEAKSAKLNELALILIAVAAGLKIYPAVFGLLYVFEKEYKKAIRLIVYGIIAFFAPFVFFGGVSGFRQFVANQTKIQATEVSSLSIQGIFNLYFRELFSNQNAASVVMWIIVAVTAVLLLFIFIKTEHYFIRLAVLASVMCLLPAWSGGYTAAYFLLPLIYYLKNDNRDFEDKALNMLSAPINISFALIFTLLQIGNEFDTASIITTLGCYSLLISITAFGITEILRRKKLHKDN
ncbi:MAG: DUF2029 domain-containing protein [Eubacterium sp.]|nr:DUF2029 domain-containing protein [Eubacterium sp.]